MEVYRKIYPYGKDVFEKRLMEKIAAPSLFRLNCIPYYGKIVRNRVFLGDIKNNQFQILTYPSFDDFSCFNKKTIIFLAPSCICGEINEYAGQTVADYIISKTGIVKATAIFWLCMCGLITLTCIIAMFLEGAEIQMLLLPVIIALCLWIVYSLMKVPQSERDALHRLMEDLEV